MKTKIVSSLAILALGFFTSNINAETRSRGADDPSGHVSGGGGADDPAGHHHGDDHEIEGREDFHGHIILSPTVNAPQRARGIAELEHENEEGSVLYKVEVRTFGLAAGTYSLSGVLLSRASTNVLGELTVTGSRARADLVLPAGVNATDIRQIVVSDGGGNPVLVGDVTLATPGTSTALKSSIRLRAGPAVPDVKGRASIKVNRRRGQVTQRFTLVASKLPANTVVNIVVDGNQAGSATINQRGGLVIRTLAADLVNVRTVGLVSSNDGAELATARF